MRGLAADVKTISTLLLSSGDLTADRRFAWARDCEEKGDLQGAADLLVQALERTPGYASAWFALGEVRERLADRAGAIEAFGKARAADPDDRQGAALHLARLGAAEAATAMPAAYVRALFDHYAPDFDRALLQGLGYRAPALLRDAVARVAGGSPQFSSMLDLGCGTGLAGAAFRTCVAELIGVDLSPAMVAQARAKHLYDRLDVLDLLEFLRRDAEGGRRHALIVAADVFTYVADLVPVFDAVRAVLAPAGLFAFTVETHPGSGVVLGEELRYAHASATVQAALAAAHLQPCILEAASTRTEKGVPVPGLLVVAAAF